MLVLLFSFTLVCGVMSIKHKHAIFYLLINTSKCYCTIKFLAGPSLCHFVTLTIKYDIDIYCKRKIKMMEPLHVQFAAVLVCCH